MATQYYTITSTGKSYAVDTSTGVATLVSSIPSGGATITQSALPTVVGNNISIQWPSGTTTATTAPASTTTTAPATTSTTSTPATSPTTSSAANPGYSEEYSSVSLTNGQQYYVNNSTGQATLVTASTPMPSGIYNENTYVGLTSLPTTLSNSSVKVIAPTSSTASTPTSVSSAVATATPSTALPNVNLQAGSTDTADVTALQNWLVANGYMTQAQMNTGPGTYGAQTTAAVQALQNHLVSIGAMTAAQAATGPGIFGPQTYSSTTTAGANANSSYTAPAATTTAPVSSTTPAATTTTPAASTASTPASTTSAATTTPPASSTISSSTGSNTLTTTPSTTSTSSTAGSASDPVLAAFNSSLSSGGTSDDAQAAATAAAAAEQSSATTTGLAGLAAAVAQGGYTIPATLQITPALVAQFLSYAHQVVDPQTQQAITNEAAGINASLSNQATVYQNNVAQTEQNFGQTLAANDNTAAGNGQAFSGQRNINDLNLANTTNLGLSSLASNANYGISSTLQSGASAVGASNTGQFQLPSLTSGSVGLSGGQRGSTNNTSALTYNYNPSSYTVGTIPTTGNTNVNNLAANYQDQYSTLAGNNSNGSRSINDLLGMMTGLPANYTPFAGGNATTGLN